MLKRWILYAALLALPAIPLARAAGADHGAGHGEPSAHVEAASGGTAGAEEHEAQRPLIADPTDSQTWYSALWVVIIFLVLLAVLYPTAWKGVLAGLKKREERIRKGIADVEAARVKAEATLKEYNSRLAAAEQQVRDLISKAARDGEQIAASIRTRAQQEAEEIKERANKDIEAAGKQAIAELYERAADLATTVAAKIIQRELKPEDQRELVSRSLDQLQTVAKRN